MAKYPVSGGNDDFKRVPAGTHLAICNLIADIGWQPGSQMFPKPKIKLYIRFEVPAERVTYQKDGHEVEGPLSIGNFYTASMNEKATLRLHLEGWRSRKFTDEEAEDFDVKNVLGKPCMISVVESSKGGKTYSNITSVSGLPKGMTANKPENPLIYYGPDDESAYEKLPEWLRKKIDEQLAEPEPEEKPPPAEEPNGGRNFEDDDIPFAALHKWEC